MSASQIEIRVRYSETDRMGYVYYGNYAAYLEVARVETLRSKGITYRQLEDDGILLPVSDYQIRYHLPAYYDDILTIHTTISDYQGGVRLTFNYKVFNASSKLIAEATTTLVFVKAATGKPCAPPAGIIHLLQNL